MAAVRGATKAERDVERAKLRKQRRALMFADRIRAAKTPLERLKVACDFIQAVARDLDPGEVDDVTRDLLKTADGRNQP